MKIVVIIFKKGKFSENNGYFWGTSGVKKGKKGGKMSVNDNFLVWQRVVLRRWMGLTAVLLL